MQLIMGCPNSALSRMHCATLNKKNVYALETVQGLKEVYGSTRPYKVTDQDNGMLMNQKEELN